MPNTIQMRRSGLLGISLPSFVQAKSATQASGTSLTVTPTTAPTAGNIVVVLAVTIGTVPTTPAGWSLIQSDGAPFYAFAHRVGAGETSYTFTVSSNSINDLFYAEYSGCTHVPTSSDVIIDNVQSSTAVFLSGIQVNHAFLSWVWINNASAAYAGDGAFGMTFQHPVYISFPAGIAGYPNLTMSSWAGIITDPGPALEGTTSPAGYTCSINLLQLY